MVDAHDRVVSPGEGPSYKLRRLWLTPEEEQVSALLACVEMIRTGTTTFCEAGTLFDVNAVADAVETVGMRAVLGRWTWDLATGPGRMQQPTEEDLEDAARYAGASAFPRYKA